MREVVGDLWAQQTRADDWVVVTTNGVVRADGASVMGRGIAREAAVRYPQLPKALGRMIRLMGNHVFGFPTFRLFTFPVKHHWKDQADPVLISRSARELEELALYLDIGRIFLVRPGCGNGRLAWPEVRPLLSRFFSGSRFVVVERAP